MLLHDGAISGFALQVAAILMQAATDMDAAPALPISQAPQDPPAQRKRLTHKQAAPEILAPRDEDEPLAVPMEVPDDGDELRKVLKQLYHQLDKFRTRAWAALDEQQQVSPQKSHLYRSPLKKLTLKAKRKLVDEWIEEDTPFAKMLSKVAILWAQDTLHTHGDHRVWRGQQALFTWNGAFGILDKEKILGEAWPPAEDVVAILKMGDHLHDIVGEMQAFMDFLKERHHLDKYCWAFELCEERYEHARSLSRSPEIGSEESPGKSTHWSESSGQELDKVDEEPLRVHAHACLRFGSVTTLRRDIELRFLDGFAVPAAAASARKRKAGDFDLSGNAGFFYLQVAKTSGIVQGGNWHPFKNYLVNSDWAANLWQQGKVSAATARAVIVQCKKNVPYLLTNFDRVQKEMTRTSLEDTVTKTLQSLEQKMQPCRRIPEVEAWEQTFTQVQFRYNFLVLDGPSKMGKTLFCRSRSLGSNGPLLEIDCAGADTPDLSQYEFGKHTMILCDEGSASMVLRYKKLFQASASYTRLCSSKTNCHAYDVWAHAVKFVVTSNRWWAETERLPREDSDWLWQNSVYVYVDQPLWLQDGNDHVRG